MTESAADREPDTLHPSTPEVFREMAALPAGFRDETCALVCADRLVVALDISACRVAFGQVRSDGSTAFDAVIEIPGDTFDQVIAVLVAARDRQRKMRDALARGDVEAIAQVESPPFTTDQLFEEVEYGGKLHQVLLECDGRDRAPEQVRAAFALLPEGVRDIAHRWGLSDSVFGDEALEFFRANPDALKSLDGGSGTN